MIDNIIHFQLKNINIILEQSNASILELKRLKTAVQNLDVGVSATKDKTAKDVPLVKVFACKSYLPLRSYEALQAFEATLVGDAQDDLVSAHINKMIVIIILFILFLYRR